MNLAINLIELLKFEGSY